MPGLFTLTERPLAVSRSGNASTFNTAAGGVPPVLRGSAAAGKLTLRPGSRTSMNEFGLDVTERAFDCATEVAQTLKPELHDPDPYNPGMVCTDSGVDDGEGRQSIVRATYKGLIRGRLREPRRCLTTDTEMQEATVNSKKVEGIAVPTAVYTLRGALDREPSNSDVGHYGTPPRAPTVPAGYDFTAPIVGAGTLTLHFIPNPRGWLLEKRDWNEAGAYYEATEQWRLRYLYAGGAAT